MAPSKRKSLKKRFFDDVSMERDGRSPIKSKKRKLSNKLGPQWTTSEIKRFYKAYRDHGKDWKKVAVEVRNRTTEMVEALYNLNRAYLSLPEGMASVAGLVAMMTDHYNVLEGNDSECESTGVPEISRNVLNRKKTKIKHASKDMDSPPEHLQSSIGYLSFLRSGCGHPRPVGKRSPRYPVSHLPKNDYKENQSIVDVRYAYMGTDPKTVTMTEAGERRDFPEITTIPYTTAMQVLTSPAQSQGRKKLNDASTGEDCLGGDSASKGSDLGDCRMDTSILANMEGVGTVEIHKTGKKYYGRKINFEESGTALSDDDGEACSGTEGKKSVTPGRGVNIEVSGPKFDETSSSMISKTQRHFSGDEFSALDALQTLANLSAIESGSSIQLNDGQTRSFGDDTCTIAEAASSSQQKDEVKYLDENLLRHARSVSEGNSVKKSKLGKAGGYVSERSNIYASHSNMLKRKAQPSIVNLSGPEIHFSHSSYLLETKNLIDGTPMEKHAIPAPDTSEVLEPIRLSSDLLSEDQNKATDVRVCSLEGSPPGLTSQKSSRRKMNLNRDPSHECTCSPSIARDQIFEHLSHHKFFNQKAKVTRCLSSNLVRRWCIFEWFYSAVDYPWFAKREFEEYLNHVGLGHVPRLTRVEWGVIRSSLGKPRRFSARFLLEERGKLDQYRESVRMHYAELRASVRKGLPADLAKPLSVGQRILALFPGSRVPHIGSILTVDYDECRVQFDSPSAGVKFVKDIDCMPLYPLENMPEALKKRFSRASSPLEGIANSSIRGFASTRHAETAGALDGPSQLIKDEDALVLFNTQASSALFNLKQHNAHPRPLIPPWVKTANVVRSSDEARETDKSSLSHEQASVVLDIVAESRQRARSLVDAAVKVISTIEQEEEEDAFNKIGEALDSMDHKPGPENRVESVSSPERPNGEAEISGREISCNGMPSQPSKPEDVCRAPEPEIPSDLITSCVATLLMIQSCTERQYPPADVAQIIDSAVTSLQPRCPQNLPIYREIQMCMGRIKTQILALVPT